MGLVFNLYFFPQLLAISEAGRAGGRQQPSRRDAVRGCWVVAPAAPGPALRPARTRMYGKQGGHRGVGPVREAAPGPGSGYKVLVQEERLISSTWLSKGLNNCAPWAGPPGWRGGGADISWGPALDHSTSTLLALLALQLTERHGGRRSRTRPRVLRARCRC